MVENSNAHKKQKLISFGMLSGSEKDYFIDNLAILLNSGMSISAALRAIQEESRSKKVKQVIEFFSQEIDSGLPLWKVLGNGNFLPDRIISLIKIGEESGRLAENLRVIAIQEDKERNFRSKVYSAIMYPVFVFFVTIFVGLGISWFILPRLSTVFSQLKLKLPFITRILIGFGDFLSIYGYIVIPLFLLLIGLIFYCLFVYKKTLFIGQAILFSIPPVRKLIQEIELSRLGYIFGTLLKAGLPPVESLKSLRDATTFLSYKKLYTFLCDNIEIGNSFQKSFKAYPGINKIIPISVQHLIITGEQSGTLAESHIKIGEMYESKIDNTTKNLAVILEPLLLVIVWLGVVSVALAVILPLYSLIGGLNSSSTEPVPQPQAIVIEESETNIGSASAAIKPENTIEILTTTVGYLNVRREPSISSEIVTRVEPGSSYEYREVKNNWYQIVFPLEPNASSETTLPREGWVSGEFVKIVE